eukprot:CAMPEP_0173190996 /NCGR_PEP_ID=MMETSP1141-20130122/12648_1 /TAXON_ID=483371 /ORGANISM="non described non described, Strain CCMP2298" /LENGTH=91 /DNA_ID=CAMNT_0014115153 /DNA_START=255 /DNA_END=529 /DNA_ORIENTATION=-
MPVQRRRHKVVHPSETAGIRDTGPARKIKGVYTSESVHVPLIRDTSTVLKIQGMHTSEGADIRDTATAEQVQRMHTPESSNISDTATPSKN